MATYTVYSTTAGTLNETLVKESVQDLITNLYPLDTPLQQILEKVPMNNVFTEQPVDTFNTITRTSAVFDASSALATTHAKPEGFTYSTGTAQYPAKLKSVAEIQGLQFAVSDTDRAMSQYGMTDRFAYEALKMTQSVVNNFEMAFWWSPGRVVGGFDLDSSGTTQLTRQTQGVCHWILRSGLQRAIYGLGKTTHTDGHGNNYGTSGGALNAGASSWAYNAGGLTLDQAMFKDNLMAQWYTITGRQAGAVGFTGAKIKNLFSQFALTANGAINERTLDAASKRIVDTVDYYETDFGVVSLNLCRYLNISGQSVSIPTTNSSDGDGTAVTVPYDEILLFMQPSYFKIGVVRPITMSPLGKTGDFEQGLIRGEQGIICTNPQAGAAIVNCIP
jgi:hypothetical protein